jgi:hypothetical protein
VRKALDQKGYSAMVSDQPQRIGSALSDFGAAVMQFLCERVDRFRISDATENDCGPAAHLRVLRTKKLQHRAQCRFANTSECGCQMFVFGSRRCSFQRSSACNFGDRRSEWFGRGRVCDGAKSTDRGEANLCVCIPECVQKSRYRFPLPYCAKFSRCFQP